MLKYLSISLLNVGIICLLFLVILSTPLSLSVYIFDQKETPQLEMRIKSGVEQLLLLESELSEQIAIVPLVGPNRRSKAIQIELVDIGDKSHFCSIEHSIQENDAFEIRKHSILRLKDGKRRCN